jgi:hypothetical protein
VADARAGAATAMAASTVDGRDAMTVLIVVIFIVAAFYLLILWYHISEAAKANLEIVSRLAIISVKISDFHDDFRSFCRYSLQTDKVPTVEEFNAAVVREEDDIDG